MTLLPMTLLPTTQPWQPGLDNADASLVSVYRGMPGDPASAIPWYVWLLENPSSPLALPGAVDLFGHDCIHILLGRGLLPEDEAFVLGFTMGRTASATKWHASLFRWCARHLYRGVYRFSGADCQVFMVAFEAARRMSGTALCGVEFRAWLERPLGELRAAVGVDPDQLRSIYALEPQLWRHTLE
jgi:hypothetical protein